MLDLNLRERGAPIAVAPIDWQRLDLESSVGALSRLGILRVERTAAAVLLFPSNFVGKLNAPGMRLTIRAKDESFYKAVERLAIEFGARKAQHHTPLNTEEEGDDIVSPFVAALSACIDEGVPWRYAKRLEATSRPRGKPEMAKTISAFAAKGILHKIFACRSDREQFETFSSVVWTAYRCLPGAPGFTPQKSKRAAILVEALEFSREISIGAALAAATDISAQRDLVSPIGEALIHRSIAIISRADVGGVSLVSVPSGVANFVNLEKLWERAVGVLVRELVSESDRTALHGLSDSQIRLFPDGGPTINPDIVCFDSTETVGLIADAKYKILNDNEARGIPADLYQITCYVERTCARQGLLVYVGSNDSIVDLGRSLSGAKITVVRISPYRLLLDGERSLRNLMGSAILTPIESVG